jgi:hypothetical protein
MTKTNFVQLLLMFLKRQVLLIPVLNKCSVRHHLNTLNYYTIIHLRRTINTIRSMLFSRRNNCITAVISSKFLEMYHKETDYILLYQTYMFYTVAYVFSRN